MTAGARVSKKQRDKIKKKVYRCDSYCTSFTKGGEINIISFSYHKRLKLSIYWFYFFFITWRNCTYQSAKFSLLCAKRPLQVPLSASSSIRENISACLLKQNICVVEFFLLIQILMIKYIIITGCPSFHPPYSLGPFLPLDVRHTYWMVRIWREKKRPLDMNHTTSVTWRATEGRGDWRGRL